MKKLLTTVACGAGILATSLGWQADASACGGFFCDNQQPVNQAAERIIFADNADGTVTAVVQILYQGPSERFAWVLPVPTVPTFDVSSNVAFQRLQQASNPTYRLNTEVEGECKEDEFAGNNAVAAPTAEGDGSGGADAGAGGGGVTVLASGFVGPYEYDVIEVEMGVADKVQVALDWLEANSYDVSAVGPQVIEPYLEDGMKLMAFKLNKGSNAGDIRPIEITYDADVPMIPIKLTAVAANDDMGVLTWVLGESRAVPINYKDLKLNEAAINWFRPGSTYDDVVTMAADEAMGQGFVTEQAGPTADFAETVWSAGDQSGWQRFRDQSWSGRELQLLDELNWTYNTFDPMTGEQLPWDGMSEAIAQAFPLATPETREMIVQCGSCAFDAQTELPADFAADDYLDAVEEWVIRPMRETQELLESRPYVTRMYTTMSAAEMTADPVFDFNPDLPAYDNVHVGRQIIECNPEIYQWEAPWRAELPSGLVVRGAEQGVWPILAGEEMPANAQVLQQSTEGEGEVVEDNTETIQQRLEANNEAVPKNPAPTSGGAVDGIDDTGDESSCSAVGAGSGAPASLFGLVVLGLVGWLRRRR